jgi:hypothetical protein
MNLFKLYACVAAAALSVGAMPANAAVDPTEVDAVVAAVKAANTDFKAFCQKGPDGMRQAMMPIMMNLVGSGKIKSNPQEVGQEAGMKMGKECRGG